MKRFFAASAAAVALVLIAGAGVHADPTTTAVHWSYSFTPTMPQNTVYSDQGQTGGVVFTAPQANNPAVATSLVPTNGTSSTATQVIATNLTVFAPVTSSATNPATVTNGPYGITMTLFTSAGGNTTPQTLTFTGSLTGSFTQDDGALVTNTWNNPTQSVTMGGYTFTVALDVYAGPGDQSDPQTGSINALVTVANATLGSSSNSPEPSTMLLSGLGLSFLGGAAWRKRRQSRAATA